MAVVQLTRRLFLAAASALGAGAMVGCGRGGRGTSASKQPLLAYRRSTRGTRASRAAKEHAASHRYATAIAAASDPAHPGDNARIVAIHVSAAQLDAWFGSGQQVVDLRRI